jgi:hypothetical protein
MPHQMPKSPTATMEKMLPKIKLTLYPIGTLKMLPAKPSNVRTIIARIILPVF